MTTKKFLTDIEVDYSGITIAGQKISLSPEASKTIALKLQQHQERCENYFLHGQAVTNEELEQIKK